MAISSFLLACSVLLADGLQTAPERLRALLSRDAREVLPMPCCYDGLTARLIEQHGFEVTFMTGFGVSAVHGLPDTGLISYGEMVASAQRICASLDAIPCIGDGDTGYGNAVSVKRTVRGYAQAGLAGIMIEDQVAPKRCGHTRGKSVVDRDAALRRVAAAVDAARAPGGGDLVVVARTDARGPLGLDEAIARARAFRELGADVTFVEAPTSEAELARVGAEIEGPKLANLLEYGETPILPDAELARLGFKLAARPLTLLSASVRAMDAALAKLRADGSGGGALARAAVAADAPAGALHDFAEVCDAVGFTEYDAEAARYVDPAGP